MSCVPSFNETRKGHHLCGIFSPNPQPQSKHVKTSNKSKLRGILQTPDQHSGRLSRSQKTGKTEELLQIIED